MRLMNCFFFANRCSALNLFSYMTKSELVSVILPTYNHSHFLKSAIESVLSQTYKNWELIIIDNHSTDLTDEVINQFKDSRIKVFKVHNNGVIAVSRNIGISKASGFWIAFLDSDDWWVPEKLMTCLSLNKEGDDLLFHDLHIIGNSPSIFTAKLLKGKNYEIPVLKDLIINGNFICNSSVIVKRSILNKIGKINENTQLIASEDYHTWMRISTISNNFKYIPEVLGYYTYHLGGVSKKDMSISMRFACNEFLKQLNYKEMRLYEGRLAYVEGRYLMTQNIFNQPISKFYQAIIKSKLSIKVKSFYLLINCFFNYFFK